MSMSIWGDFQIGISVPLIENKSKAYSMQFFTCTLGIRSFKIIGTFPTRFQVFSLMLQYIYY